MELLISVSMRSRAKVRQSAKTPITCGAQRMEYDLVIAADGKEIAGRCLKNGISEVIFDRNGFLYHGRVRALAEAAREAGLKF